MPDASKVSGSLLILKVKELQAGRQAQTDSKQQAAAVAHLAPWASAEGRPSPAACAHTLAGKPQHPKLAPASTVAWAGRGLTCP